MRISAWRPRAALKVFVGHLVQFGISVGEAGVCVLARAVQPLLQLQVLLPSSDQLPCRHGSQMPDVPEYVPAAHSVHTVLPSYRAHTRTGTNQCLNTDTREFLKSCTVASECVSTHVLSLVSI